MTLFLPLLIWRHVQIFYHQSTEAFKMIAYIISCSLRQCEFCFYIAVNYRSPLGKYAIMPTQNIDIWNQTKWGVGKRVLRRWLIANVHTSSVDPNCATQNWSANGIEVINHCFGIILFGTILRSDMEWWFRMYIAIYQYLNTSSHIIHYDMRVSYCFQNEATLDTGLLV